MAATTWREERRQRWIWDGAEEEAEEEEEERRERQKGLEIDRIIGRQIEGWANRGRENERFLKEIGCIETEKAHRKGWCNSFKGEKQTRKIREAEKSDGEEMSSSALPHRQMKVVHRTHQQHSRRKEQNSTVETPKPAWCHFYWMIKQFKAMHIIWNFFF